MQLYKQKIVAAKKGHELLKRKADALKKKFKEIMKDLLDSKKKMGEECKEAFFLMAEAKYAAGEFQYGSPYSGARSQRQ
jgi:V-type H+-transporting ATPase subunit D